MSFCKNSWYLLPLIVTACANIPPVSQQDGSSDAKVTVLLDAGKRCVDNDSCKSGFCIDIMGNKQCAATCQDDGSCGGKLICAAANPRQNNSPKICLPKARQLCAPCETDAECQEVGALCHELDGAKVCLGPCDGPQSCPTGYACQEIIENISGNTVRQCWPEINTCACNANSSGAVRECFKRNEFGTCYGLEMCDGNAGGWQDCDARTAAVEVCDGFDNDCDGLTDEDDDNQPLTQKCWYGYESGNPPPECTGTSICIDGQFNNCSLPPPPLTETTCDGLDNDCDGMIDEDAAGNPLTQVCQYGYEGLTAPDNCRGIQTCENGSFGECSTLPPMEFETLCDNIDEDCDGRTDKDPLGNPLTIECGYGYEDSIDSRPDECRGVKTCNAGIFSECSVSPAILDMKCDGLDEDCDGKIDDDILGTNDNCNYCGHVCPGKGKPNVYKWGCLGAGKGCMEWQCTFPFFDVDGQESNGCEVADTFYNYAKDKAFYLGSIDDSEEGTEIHACNGRLPRDLRPNIYQNNDISGKEGEDYFYFKYVKGGFITVKEGVLEIWVNRLKGNYNTAIQACLSNYYSSKTSSPIFPNDRCKTVNMNNNDNNKLQFDSSYFSEHDVYYYVKVTSLESYNRFAGNFHIQFMEKYADNDIFKSDSVCKEYDK